MLGFLAERMGAGLAAVWSAAYMFITSPVLLVLALVPTAVRAMQVVNSGGPPEGNLWSEGFVGAFRVVFAVAVLAVAAGWAPLTGGGLAPPSLADTGAAWSQPDFNWGLVVTDLAVYAMIYGLVNIVLAALTGQGMLGDTLDIATGADPGVPVTLAVFVGKNLLVIPIATIHILWALRLITLR